MGFFISHRISVDLRRQTLLAAFVLHAKKVSARHVPEVPDVPEVPRKLVPLVPEVPVVPGQNETLLAYPIISVDILKHIRITCQQTST